MDVDLGVGDGVGDGIGVGVEEVKLGAGVVVGVEVEIEECPHPVNAMIPTKQPVMRETATNLLSMGPLCDLCRIWKMVLL